MPWDIFFLEFLFITIFGSFGFWLMNIRFSPESLTSESGSKPGLDRYADENGLITSNSKDRMIGSWVIGISANIVSIPMGVMGYIKFNELWNTSIIFVLMVIFFPLVGLILLYAAYYYTKEWFYFRKTVLRMDPFPGVIGGYLSGEVTWNRRDKNQHYKVTLSCVYFKRTRTGSGRKSSFTDHEKTVWRDVTNAYEIATAEGALLKFKFKVPENLPDSERSSDSYHYWQLNVMSQGKSLRLNRDFVIPVFAPEGKYI